MADPDIRARIGLRVKQLRAEEHLTQGALSSPARLNRSFRAEVETGKRNVSVVNIERICNGLGVSPAEFFTDELFTARTEMPLTP